MPTEHDIIMNDDHEGSSLLLDERLVIMMVPHFILLHAVFGVPTVGRELCL